MAARARRWSLGVRFPARLEEGRDVVGHEQAGEDDLTRLRRSSTSKENAGCIAGSLAGDV